MTPTRTSPRGGVDALVPNSTPVERHCRWGECALRRRGLAGGSRGADRRWRGERGQMRGTGVSSPTRCTRSMKRGSDEADRRGDRPEAIELRIVLAEATSSHCSASSTCDQPRVQLGEVLGRFVGAEARLLAAAPRSTARAPRPPRRPRRRSTSAVATCGWPGAQRSRQRTSASARDPDGRARRPWPGAAASWSSRAPRRAGTLRVPRRCCPGSSRTLRPPARSTRTADPDPGRSEAPGVPPRSGRAARADGRAGDASPDCWD